MRFGLILLSVFMILLPRVFKSGKLIDWNGFIFVFFLGLFCNVLTFLHVTKGLSLWFSSLFFVYPGVFITAGLGFRYSFTAILTTPVIFNILYFSIKTFQISEFLFYNVFLGGMVLIYTFVAYLVENIFRKNFIAMEQLKDSIDEIRQLSGLLPICAKCKKIRDDKGYWQQVEIYIQQHTKATFSHGMCPSCMDETYGDKTWYQRMKAEKPH